MTDSDPAALAALAAARADHDRRARFILWLHAARPAAEAHETHRREADIQRAWSDMRFRMNPPEWID
jgi:hypothetical protein